jgi:hypothetical protein
MPLSARLKVRNESQALALDIAATARLKVYDEERDRAMIEALTSAATMNTLNGLTAGLSQLPKINPQIHNLPRQ